MSMERSILFVDRDRNEREMLAALLRKEIGCLVLECSNSEEALDILSSQSVSLLITDLFAPRDTGLELIYKAHQLHPEIATVVGVPAGDRGAVVRVLRGGALFYLNKPYESAEVVIVAARALAHHDLLVYREKKGLKTRKSEGFHGIIGKAPKMLELFGIIERVAEDGESTILIQGESGTGKELVAKAIHAFSPRAGKNFVPLNCAAIPDELLESELFGYVKGAFTGANQSKQGRIQYADGGTLFLDEIGDMKPTLQAKLLRVLQEREFEPVGGVKPIKADVRVVAATHRNLEEAVAAGRFREDLYYRLSVIPLQIPPLRERQEDIPLLIETFLQIYNRGRGNPLQGFTEDALRALACYPWPGNVRELENLVQRLTILHGGSMVTARDLPEKYCRAHNQASAAPAADAPQSQTLAPEEPRTPQPPPPAEPVEAVELDSQADFNTLVSDFEDRLILQALSRTGGNKKDAAALLNLKRTTLLEKIKKKQLDGFFSRGSGRKSSEP